MRFCSTCGAAQGEVRENLEVTTGFFPLAFLFLFCTPVIEIDGHPQRLRWGTHRFGVAPGRHRVRVYVPYLFWPQCGANVIDVDVAAGRAAHVSWYMPPLVFLKGSMRAF